MTNINQKKLLNKLSSKIKENHALLLIKKGYTNPNRSGNIKIFKNKQKWSATRTSYFKYSSRDLYGTFR